MCGERRYLWKQVRWTRDAALNQAVSELGGFDVIVNNAGIAPPSPSAIITPESIETLYSINCNDVVWGTQAAMKALRKPGHGADQREIGRNIIVGITRFTNSWPGRQRTMQGIYTHDPR